MDPNILKQLSFKYHPLNMPVGYKSPAQNGTKEDDLLDGNLVPRRHIRLLTQNMFMRPPPVKTNASDFKDARLDEFVKQFDNFDIICF